jgi:hypothetical protein
LPGPERLFKETKHHATMFGSIVAYTGRFVDGRHAAGRLQRSQAIMSRPDFHKPLHQTQSDAQPPLRPGQRSFGLRAYPLRHRRLIARARSNQFRWK